MSAHVEELLVPYLRGELETVERARVETHLADCADCRQARTDFERLAGDLARVAVPGVHWGAYRAELRDKLEQRAGRRRARWTWQWLPIPVAVAAGLTAVMLYVGLPGQGGRDDMAAVDDAMLASRLDLVKRLDMVEQLDMLEDFEVISRLDRLKPRADG